MSTDVLEAVRSRIAELGADAFYSVSPPDNQYMSGFMTDFGERSSGIIVTAHDAIFQTDSRYTEQAADQTSGFEIEKIPSELVRLGGERLTALGVSRVFYDPACLTVAEFEELRAAYSGELVGRGDVLTPLRLVKTPAEIETIRSASLLAEGVLGDVARELRPGVTERETAARIEYEFRKRGAEGAAFDTIALFGERGSLPHGIPGDRTLAEGDIVLFDLGCRREGYCSDLTRTYAFGSICGSWFEEIYAVTLAAQTRALEAVRPGATGREVDAAARDVIVEAGFGDAFGHGVGHGVGIEIHEAPRVNPRSDTPLAAGMVITIEPGIYLPERGGVRIEDLVVVTGTGCEILTRLPKELEVLHPS